MNERQLLDDEMYAAAAQAGFGCPRGIWGAIIGYSMAWTYSIRNRWVLGLLDLKPDNRVLEIGCGPGSGIRHIAKLATRGFVAGIDPSEVMWRQASRRNRDYIREKRVELKLASMSAIPYPDSAFDKVFGTNSIHFSRDLPSDLGEIRRVMKPGGMAAFSVQPLWKGATDFTAAEIGNNLKDAMTHAGFDACRIEQKRAWPRVTVCVLGQK